MWSLGFPLSLHVHIFLCVAMMNFFLTCSCSDSWKSFLLCFVAITTQHLCSSFFPRSVHSTEVLSFTIFLSDIFQITCPSQHICLLLLWILESRRERHIASAVILCLFLDDIFIWNSFFLSSTPFSPFLPAAPPLMDFQNVFRQPGCLHQQWQWALLKLDFPTCAPLACSQYPKGYLWTRPSHFFQLPCL